ncbi:MAG: hypothetical protein D6722_19915 [Bacteroidetes bacterium]|nr:MAG: hypothetical protein D6722_19915 [Bacteroidota bacterium]
MSILWLAGWAPHLSAQSLSATLRADTTTLRIGEPLPVSLSVPFDPALEMVWPTLTEGKIGGMDIIDRSGLDTIGKAGRQVLIEHFTLMAFDSGRYELPGLEIGYRRATDTSLRQIRSNGLAIDIFTVAVDTTQDIRPIKGVAQTPITLAEVLRIALLVLAILAAIGGLVWWLRRRARRPKSEVAVPAPPPVPPYDIAMRELARLEAERLWQNGDMKGYYSGLSEILRRYMEGLFGFPAMESVTHTIIRELSQRGLSARQVEAMRYLLEQADLAKFAKFRPESDENLAAMDKARDFVKDTKTWGKAPAAEASVDPTQTPPQAETPAP